MMKIKIQIFHNWNKVKIRYCDGAPFSGNVKDELQHGTKFFFRGQRIWEAVMDELLLNSLQAFLTGCSAGGLATYIHCDGFRALLPKDSRVKRLADGGFFLDVEGISKQRALWPFYSDVVHLQTLFSQRMFISNIQKLHSFRISKGSFCSAV